MIRGVPPKRIVDEIVNLISPDPSDEDGDEDDVMIVSGNSSTSSTSQLPRLPPPISVPHGMIELSSSQGSDAEETVVGKHYFVESR